MRRTNASGKVAPSAYSLRALGARPAIAAGHAADRVSQRAARGRTRRNPHGPEQVVGETGPMRKAGKFLNSAVIKLPPDDATLQPQRRFKASTRAFVPAADCRAL